MKLTKNSVFLHYFGKFMGILLFVLKYMFLSLLLKMINGFSWSANIMASPFNTKIGSFHAKTTTFQKSCQVTPSDFAHIHTFCSSIGRMNTQKKSAANSLRFWKYSSSKIWPDPPFLASACRVIDLSDLWPAFIPVCNKIQKSKLLLGVIFTHIFKIWSQKHDILFNFYAGGTSTWALVTYNNYFFNVQGHVVSEQKGTGGSYYIYVISRHICPSKSR